MKVEPGRGYSRINVLILWAKRGVRVGPGSFRMRDNPSFPVSPVRFR